MLEIKSTALISSNRLTMDPDEWVPVWFTCGGGFSGRFFSESIKYADIRPNANGDGLQMYVWNFSVVEYYGDSRENRYNPFSGHLNAHPNTADAHSRMLWQKQFIYSAIKCYELFHLLDGVQLRGPSSTARKKFYAKSCCLRRVSGEKVARTGQTFAWMLRNLFRRVRERMYTKGCLRAHHAKLNCTECVLPLTSKRFPWYEAGAQTLIGLSNLIRSLFPFQLKHGFLFGWSVNSESIQIAYESKQNAFKFQSHRTLGLNAALLSLRGTHWQCSHYKAIKVTLYSCSIVRTPLLSFSCLEIALYSHANQPATLTPTIPVVMDTVHASKWCVEFV